MSQLNPKFRSILLLLGSLSLGATGCAVEPTADNDSSDDRVGTTSQALSDGWGYVTNGLDTDWQLKNASGNFCAKAVGNVATTAACLDEAAQRWVILQKSDGNYEICRPSTVTRKTGTQAIMMDPNGPSSIVVTEWWNAQCIYPTNFTDKPTDYRIGTVALSWILKGQSTYTSRAGTFRRNGLFILDPWRWMTRNSGGVVAPAKYTGATNQQWNLISMPH